jgi:hypothetical protein
MKSKILQPKSGYINGQPVPANNKQKYLLRKGKLHEIFICRVEPHGADEEDELEEVRIGSPVTSFKLSS